MGDTYTMKIPKEIKDLFQRYIDHPKNKHLGFRKVSQFVLDFLRKQSIKINKELEELEKTT